MTALGRTAAYALGLTALWVVLAWMNEGTTYHLAPLLVALVVPVGLAFSDRDVPAGRLIIATTIGAGLALAGTGLLVAGDRLGGASLLPFGGAVTEAIVFSLAGAVGGYVLAAYRNNRS